jgi:hypothetical protein
MSSFDTKNSISFNPALEQARHRLNAKAIDSNPALEQAKRRLNTTAISLNPALEEARHRLNAKAIDSNPALEQAKYRLNTTAISSNPSLEQAVRSLNTKYNPDTFKNPALEESWRKIKQYDQPLDKKALDAHNLRLQQLRSKLTNQSASITPSAASNPNLSTQAFQDKLRQDEVDTGDIDSMKSVLSSTRWELNGKSLFDYLGSIDGQSAQQFSQ